MTNRVFYYSRFIALHMDVMHLKSGYETIDDIKLNLDEQMKLTFTLKKLTIKVRNV